MLSKYVWDKIAQENYFRNVGPKRTDILLQEKPFFSNMPGGLFFNRVHYQGNNLGSFCSMLAQDFIYDFWDNNEQGPTLTGTLQVFFLLDDGIISV